MYAITGQFNSVGGWEIKEDKLTLKLACAHIQQVVNLLNISSQRVFFHISKDEVVFDCGKRLTKVIKGPVYQRVITCLFGKDKRL